MPPEKRDPPSMMRAGAAALAAGSPERAEAIYDALLRDLPQHGGAMLGLAQVALARKQAEQALVWVAEHDRRARQPQPRSHALRARALEALDRWDAAGETWREAAQAEQGHPVAVMGLVRWLRHDGQFQAALATVDAGLAQHADNPRMVALRIGLLSGLWRGADARDAAAALGAAIETASSPNLLLRLFNRVALLHGEGEAALATWRRMRVRLEALGPAAEDGAVLSARLRLALGEVPAFCAEARALLAAGYRGKWAAGFQDVLAAMARPLGVARPKVFVIGLSKTATSSVNAALRHLGFSAWHWTHPVTNQLLRLEDANLFDALSDIPAAVMTETLAVRYPDARFILSTRPREDWQVSFIRHYRTRHGLADFAALRRLVADPATLRFGRRWCELQQELYTRHPDLGAAWDAHEARIAAAFAQQPERLLRFDLFSGDGWPELCAFLRLPAPATPFPHENAAPKARPPVG